MLYYIQSTMRGKSLAKIEKEKQNLIGNMYSGSYILLKLTGILRI